jgi:hypothetical protein
MKITRLENNFPAQTYSWNEIKNAVGEAFSAFINENGARFLCVNSGLVLLLTRNNTIMIADPTVWCNYRFIKVQDKITIEFNEGPA